MSALLRFWSEAGGLDAAGFAALAGRYADRGEAGFRRESEDGWGWVTIGSGSGRGTVTAPRR